MGAGGCVAHTSREAWLFLHDLADEKGARVRLDWGEEPPTGMHDGCSRSATCNGAELDPDVFLSILQRVKHTHRESDQPLQSCHP